MNLKNKIFISTRPEGRNDELAGYIREQGGQVQELPMIEIQPRPLEDDLKKALFRLSAYQWLIFTSPNGIWYFFHHLKQIFGHVQLPQGLKIATIGKSTAAHLHQYNLHADFINTGNTSDDFAKALTTEFGNTRPNILWPTGNLSKNVLKNKLNAKANITVIYVYNTVMPASVDQTILNQVIQDHYDLIIFTSPSGFENFKEVVDDESVLQKLRVASIGNTTTEAIQQHHVHPVLTARMSSAKGIAEHITDYYTQYNQNETSNQKQ